jgi:hypothetical protein
MNDLEVVFEHFVNSSEKPFKIHDSITVHLDNPIINVILNQYALQTSTARAGLLQSLLPRKRMTEIIKDSANKLIELAETDTNVYVKTLGNMMHNIASSGTLNLAPFLSIPSLNSFLEKASSKCIWILTFSKGNLPLVSSGNGILVNSLPKQFNFKWV